MTDRPLASAGADDDDGGRVQHRAHALRLRAVLPREAHREGLGRGFDVEVQRDDAVLDVPVDLVAGVGEDGEHLAVVRQHLGLEGVDVAVVGQGREVLEENRPDALAVVVVGDVEGNLGAVLGDPVVAADADDVVADHRHEGHAVVVVDLGEAPDVTVAEVAHRREEAQVDRLVGLARVETTDPLGVGGLDRPQPADRAVAQDDVGLRQYRVTRRELRHVDNPARRALPDPGMCVATAHTGPKG